MRGPKSWWRLVPVFLFLCLCVAVATFSGCARRSDRAGSITLAGSTSVQPFAEMLAEEYARRYPDRPPVNVQGGGSSAGARAAFSGTAHIGMMSREPAESEKELVPTVIAVDALALIVHRDNKVADLTKDQIRGIFSGSITDWGELGGTPGTIHVISREEGSGTRGAFDELIMEGDDVMARAIVQDSNGAVRETVAGDPRAIGYVSLGLVDERVRAVRVDGVEASVESVRRREYTLVRPFLFVVKGDYTPEAKAFLDFVLGEDGQRILAEEGLVTNQR